MSTYRTSLLLAIAASIAILLGSTWLHAAPNAAANPSGPAAPADSVTLEAEQDS